MTTTGEARRATITGLTNATAYTFAATATNSVGTGPASAPSAAVTPFDTLLLLLSPTAVAATPGDTTAIVTFDAPLVSVEGVTTYTARAYRAADNALVATTEPTTARAVTVTGLANGTPVYLTVTAAELGLALGPASAPSNTLTPFGPPFAPSAPRSACDPPRVSCDGQLALVFDPPAARPDGTPGDNGAPITSYLVTAHGYADTVLGTQPLPTTSGAYTGLTNGEGYTFTVAAVNAAGPGQSSAASVPLTPAGLPAAPADVTAFAEVRAAMVSWTPPYDNGSPVTSYTVTASPGGRSVSTADPVTTVDGLDPGTSYTFTVVAHNAVGAGPASAPSNSVVPIGPPASPTDVTATAGDGWAQVSWSAPTELGGDDSFLAYRVTVSPGGATRYVVDPTTTVTVTGLTNGTPYTFTVAASNGSGDSAPSAPSAPVTPTGAGQPPPGGSNGPGPAAPTGVSVTIAPRQATVSWTDTDPAVVSYTLTGAPAGPITVAAPATSITVTELNDGESYYFYVVATDAAGGQAWSAPSYVTLPAVLVGLGDSFSSGEGAPPYEQGTGAPNEGCRRSVYSGVRGTTGGTVGVTPYVVPSVIAVNVACSGAKTSALLTESFKGEPPQIQHLTGNERFLALTVGGDNLDPKGISQIIKQCVNSPGNENDFPCEPRLDAESPPLKQRIENLESTLVPVYRQLHDRSRFADIYVLGYPKVFASGITGTCNYIRATDTEYLNERIVQLDAVIQRAVILANAENGTKQIHYLDMIGPFTGHELCIKNENDSYFNGFGYGPNSVAPYIANQNGLDTPFHPNFGGSHTMGKQLASAIQGNYR